MKYLEACGFIHICEVLLVVSIAHLNSVPLQKHVIVKTIMKYKKYFKISAERKTQPSK